MGKDDIFALGFVAAIIGAIWLLRRNAGRKNAAACAKAAADARASVLAEISAAAIAHGGSVAVHIGNGGSHGATDRSARYDDDQFDDYPSGRAGLRRVDALHIVDGDGRPVGELLDGVQHRPDASNGDGGAVPARGIGRGGRAAGGV